MEARLMVSNDDLLLMLLEEAEQRTTFRADHHIENGLMQLRRADWTESLKWPHVPTTIQDNSARFVLILLDEDIVSITRRWYHPMDGAQRAQQRFLLHTQLDEAIGALADAIFFVNNI